MQKKLFKFSLFLVAFLFQVEQFFYHANQIEVMHNLILNQYWNYLLKNKINLSYNLPMAVVVYPLIIKINKLFLA